ncbi:hypothetical protein LTR57_004182 [Friedmanniomyces endolithicus]|nr:hypothetical protein LTR57_004182 [Friedmanniomyces endolithicus]
MPFSLKKSKHTITANWFPDSQHPDLPLKPVAPAATPRPQTTLNRSASVSDRYSSGHAGDDFGQPSPQLSSGLSRSQTVLRREATGASRNSNAPNDYQGSPSPTWSPDFAQLPTPNEQHEYFGAGGSMSTAQHTVSAGKTSSDSGQNPLPLDRWSQRRLQRLNTEQGFREQRQGGQAILSPPSSEHSSGFNTAAAASGGPYSGQEPQPQLPLHQPSQPHTAQQPAYPSSRTAQPAHTNTGLAIQTQPAYSHQQYSPPHSASQLQSQASTQQGRSFSPPEDLSMSSNNGNLPPPRSAKSGGGNRQSVHNGLSSREISAVGSGLQQQGVPAFNSSVVPPTGQGQSYKGSSQAQQPGDVGRVTPQPLQLSEDMTEEDVNQLIKDHKELREKYTKVKKYYFEKEDQVKQLQNSLAHQRLSLSRTSLDDSEYTTRFNRLDGLIAQLAFSIRKSWRSLPDWLHKSVNKDAVATGKQEMTAAGRTFISRWLVEDCFDKYFHPDLDTPLSAQLRQVQRNIRLFAPLAQTVEEEDFLTSKVVNWRLATLEGLQDTLRGPQCPANRAAFTDMLKEQLIAALAVHLQDPAPSDLEGGVHMIVELVVSIAIHLPVESRDVVVEYFRPGLGIMAEQMKVESGIPALGVSIHDENAERASLRSASSEHTDMTETSLPSGGGGGEAQPRKRSMLSALTGSGKPKNTPPAQQQQQQQHQPQHPQQGKHPGVATGSSSSLLSGAPGRPESSQGAGLGQGMGAKEEGLPPRVRMAAGIGVSVRGRSVLVKAPVFGC